MKWSKSYLFTLREAPADAEIPSHVLMMRAGMIRKVAAGIYTYGPLALKAIRRFEQIVREELNKRGCQELLMPMVQPKELWEETGRWQEMGEGLQKFKNRNGHEFCLGATHEEVITDFVRKDVKSYRDLPFNLYQIQTKYRDEIRPRFGLMRGREFLMKDAYSFDRDQEGAEGSYQLMREAYQAIFTRLGARFVVVAADSGNIGGNRSEEFHILADSGEDQLLVSEDGLFAANVEVCPALLKEESGTASSDKASVQGGAPEEFATPGLKTIADLAKSTGIGPEQLVKTMFFMTEAQEPICVLLRGSDEANPVKIKNALRLANPPRLLVDQEVKDLTGAWPGSCGPLGLKIPIYVDQAVERMDNYIVGANRDGFHLKGVSHRRGDFKLTQVADLRMAQEGDPNPQGQGQLKAYRGIEVGHIFYLGTKYSQAMEAQFLGEDGQLKPIEMGCYGIGIGRSIQAVIEQNHDKDGIIWPPSVAPFHVHICMLDPDEPAVQSLVEEVEVALTADGYEVFIDDRAERPGVKFKDADLLGFPLRINLGSRGLQQAEVEIVERRNKSIIKVSPKSLVGALLEKLKELQ